MDKTSNNAFIVGAVVILLLLGGAFLVFRPQQAAPAVPTPTLASASPTEGVTPTAGEAMEEETTKKAETMEVTLAEVKGSGQTGKAVLTQVNGKTNVVLTLSTDPSLKEAQPAHIHKGSCNAPGDVVYPLTDVVDGKSVTTVNASLSDLRGQLPLLINIHKSAPELKVYTACGPLK